MDERLAEQIGENAFEGQRQVVLQGFHGGGKAPYGYILQSIEDPNGKVDRAGHPVKHVQFVVDPEHAPIVVRIYVEYASRRGYKKIAEGLNQDGIISPGGTTWATSAVRTILHNEAYLGWRVWNKTRRNKKLLRGTVVRKPRKDWIIFKEAHLPIITEKHWDAVRERLGEIHVHVTNGRGNRATGASPRIFTGILRCETCGANFVASGRKRKGALTRYYKCSFRANRGATVCSNSRMVREDNLLEAVTDILTKKILIPEMVDQVLEEIQQKSEEEFGGVEGKLKDLRSQIQKANRGIQNLVLSIESGGPIQELVDRLKETKSRKSRLETELAETTEMRVPEPADVVAADVSEGLRKLREALACATPEEIKMLFREHVTEIRIPKIGPAQLVANPAGLLRCINMVTPRGVEPPFPE